MEILYGNNDGNIPKIPGFDMLDFSIKTKISTLKLLNKILGLTNKRKSHDSHPA